LRKISASAELLADKVSNTVIIKCIAAETIEELDIFSPECHPKLSSESHRGVIAVAEDKTSHQVQIAAYIFIKEFFSTNR
jgi:hypothetical protein